MHSKLESLHALVWSRFFAPETELFYTFINPATGKPVLPTLEEVWRCVPNTAGWQTPIEDCCLCSGIYLESMLLRHASAPTDENERKVRSVFAGLKRLASAGRR